ncbi:hypothetical protein OAF74_00390 [bacterium]|nr:hypothetical protein [Planctomicrobium sp.]MDB4731269.1 hypothetical protein [bacterium]
MKNSDRESHGITTASATNCVNSTAKKHDSFLKLITQKRGKSEAFKEDEDFRKVVDQLHLLHRSVAKKKREKKRLALGI